MTVYYEPLGVDFSAALVDGIRARLADAPPEDLARTTLLLPTQRMARRVQDVFASHGATLMPRIELVSDLSPLIPWHPLPDAQKAGALVLELAEVVAPLLERTGLAPESATLDLACSLTDLMREMAEEGVSGDDLQAIDPGHLAHHWQDSLRFLQIITRMLAQTDLHLGEDVQRLVLDALSAQWEAAAPGRVIVAGSTGSRAPTMRLMKMVARLPEGAVILPGLDMDMPEAAWRALDAECQDHPQYRHHAFLSAMELPRDALDQWSRRPPVTGSRNRLVSLALRPPPATDAWRIEGPDLTDLDEACAGLTLVEAASPLEEAEAIALRLRKAAAAGQRAALISPDRTLSREVTACLDRWGIAPDDSAGRPLHLSPPGRLLRQTADLRGHPVEAEALVALLKHPLTHSGGKRRDHLRLTRLLEVGWLRGGPLHPTREAFDLWRADRDSFASGWSDWLGQVLDRLAREVEDGPLSAHLADHRALLDLVTTGSAPDAKPGGGLWDEAAGRTALELFEGLTQDAAASTLAIGAGAYGRYLHSLMTAAEVRVPDTAFPDVMIWGALEARVQGAELVILGGLNDGTWPGLPGPDMWMSRQMRRVAGLRAPERTVGLSAHDFQQAIAGAEVWLTRAVKDADAQTVPSRWLNRITNLLGGLGPDGAAALDGMKARGQAALRAARAQTLPRPRHEAPLAKRPAPKPPVAARRRQLSVTAIETLIRDPYAIYARYVLGLRPLDPLRPPSDAAMRGLVVHEALAEAGVDAMRADALLDHLRRALRTHIPSPAQQMLWLGRFARIAEEFAKTEQARRALGHPAVVEDEGRWQVPGLDFTLTAKADRIDQRHGAAAVFDYKTGAPPTKDQQTYYAKQLLLEALMVEAGAFPDLDAMPVEEVTYLGVGGQGGAIKTLKTAMTDEIRADTLDGLRELIGFYLTDAPFPARLAHELLKYASDYDHLSRYGEWDDTQPYQVGPVG